MRLLDIGGAFVDPEAVVALRANEESTGKYLTEVRYYWSGMPQEGVVWGSRPLADVVFDLEELIG